MSQEKTDKEIADLGNHMRKSRMTWFWYLVMRALMVVESLVWTVMDVTRSARMRVAAKINSNYERFNKR